MTHVRQLGRSLIIKQVGRRCTFHRHLSAQFLSLLAQEVHSVRAHHSLCFLLLVPIHPRFLFDTISTKYHRLLESLLTPHMFLH